MDSSLHRRRSHDIVDGLQLRFNGDHAMSTFSSEQCPNAETYINSIKPRFKKSALKLWMYKTGIVLALLAYFAYLIVALCHNFDKAKGLLIATVLFVAGWTYLQIIAPFVTHQKFKFDLIDGISNWWQNFQYKILVKTLFCALIFLSIVIFLVYDAWYNPSRLISLAGMFLMIAVLILFSSDRQKINWRIVFSAFVFQFAIGLICLKWTVGYKAFEFVSNKTVSFLHYTTYGTDFVYGFLSKPPNICSMSPVFVFTILQVIIYFGSVISLLFYLGVIQFVMSKVGRLLEFFIGATALESFYAGCCTMLGQAEAPIVIQPYLKQCTRSEINTIMTIGFACSAGSVFAAYVSMGACPLYVLTACLMSSPCALAVSKILVPETEESKLKDLKNVDLTEVKSRNIIEAISSGACSVIIVVACIAANLVAFIALLSFVDESVRYFADLVGLNIGFQTLFGYVFFPFAFVMNVSDKPDWDSKIKETFLFAELLGTKMALNEFVAFKNLGDFIVNAKISGRAEMMASYALASFANFGSVGVQLGTLANLCPEIKNVVAEMALKALLGGTMCSIFTACIAGALFDEHFSCTPQTFATNCTRV